MAPIHGPFSLPMAPAAQELHLEESRLEGLQLGTLWGYKSWILHALANQGCAIVL